MELGQVFTPPEVANFMVDLVADELKEDTKILDPCIGRNIFFDSLNSRASSFEFHGVEIDSTLLVESTRNVFQDSRNFLFEGNFFDFSTKKTDSAPPEAASKPRAPDPANRSRHRLFLIIGRNQLNSASR